LGGKAPEKGVGGGCESEIPQASSASRGRFRAESGHADERGERGGIGEGGNSHGSTLQRPQSLRDEAGAKTDVCVSEVDSRHELAPGLVRGSRPRIRPLHAQSQRSRGSCVCVGRARECAVDEVADDDAPVDQTLVDDDAPADDSDTSDRVDEKAAKAEKDAEQAAEKAEKEAQKAAENAAKEAEKAAKDAADAPANNVSKRSEQAAKNANENSTKKGPGKKDAGD
jgi:hypothetical protein